MQGYKTLITNGVIFIAGLMSYWGVVIPEDEQTAMALGLTATVNAVLRFVTKTPVGKSE